MELPRGPNCGQSQGTQVRRAGEKHPSLSPSKVSSPASIFHGPSHLEASGLGAWGGPQVSVPGSTDLGRNWIWVGAGLEQRITSIEREVGVAGIVQLRDGGSLDSHNRPVKLV